MADGQNNENPRQPRNLQGLLNFCTEITAREDNTRPTDFAQLDPEVCVIIFLFVDYYSNTNIKHLTQSAWQETQRPPLGKAAQPKKGKNIM